MLTRCRTILTGIALLALDAPALAQSCPALRVRNPTGNYIVPGVKGRHSVFRHSRA